jgi:sarcosine oxidase, subunit gamma
MSAPALSLNQRRGRLGLKGPRAAQWLSAYGIALPAAPNTWTQAAGPADDDALLVARLGSAEYFLEGGNAGTALKDIAADLTANPAGVYPVLREDWAFHLGGERALEVLAQVCNVNFAALPLDTQPLIMTLMIGVAVLVVPQIVAGAQGGPPLRHYRIWCDPTFGPYLGESLAAVVNECGGRYTGVSG